MSRLVQEFTKGLWKEIPPFRLVLGLCPALACSTTVDNGFGMGMCLTFVLTCSNLFVSMLRKIIPEEVRLACFIVIVATFVIIVELVTQAYFYPLYLALGIFIPLIVVNCIALGRAEAFASKNPVIYSIMDGLGIGLGYTLSLMTVALFRELLGKGTLWGHHIMWSGFQPISFLQKAPGAFVCLGLLLGIMNLFGSEK
ncbi:MAG: electron transport complex subunit E [Candidatus Desulfofervidaceae bacterium]|nr:electron transport complex subunit E [Candidatus Desulfofervidaceae bacterium]